MKNVCVRGNRRLEITGTYKPWLQTTFWNLEEQMIFVEK